MKKIILIAAMALGFVVTAVAANPVDKATNALEKTFGGKVRAVGIRRDWGNGICHPIHCNLCPALGVRYTF